MPEAAEVLRKIAAVLQKVVTGGGGGRRRKLWLNPLSELPHLLLQFQMTVWYWEGNPQYFITLGYLVFYNIILLSTGCHVDPTCAFCRH